MLGDPVDAAQFVITSDGQLEMVVPGPTLYASVLPPANASAVMLQVVFKTTPSTTGTFVWSGDTVTWSSPTITRPQNNVSYNVFSFFRCG